MNLQLEPVSFEFNNCYEGEMNTIIKCCFHKNYLLSQFKRWGYYGIDVKQNSAVLKNKDFFEANELKLLGLKLKTIFVKKHECISSKVIDTLKNGIPVIVGIHITHLPWDPNYKKDYDLIHSFTIYKYNPDTKSFICSDSMYKTNTAVLPVEEFDAGGLRFFQYIEETDPQLPAPDARQLLEQRAAEILNKTPNDFDLIRESSKTASASLKNMPDTMTIDDVLLSDLYMTLRDLARAREYMSYIITEALDDHILSSLFKLAMNKWIYVRSLYMKKCLVTEKKEILSDISRVLHETADLEENTARYITEGKTEYIERYLKEPVFQETAANTGTYTNPTYRQPIDLHEFYNNKGFGPYVDHDEACFALSGEYFIESDEGKDFFYPGRNDNILCSGQTIPVDSIQASQLIIQGAEEFGDFSHTVCIQYESGQTQEITLDIPVWYTEILGNEKVILNNHTIKKIDNKVKMASFYGKIFEKRFPLSKGEKIISITLPSEGRFHLFKLFLDN